MKKWITKIMQIFQYKIKDSDEIKEMAANSISEVITINKEIGLEIDVIGAIDEDNARNHISNQQKNNIQAMQNNKVPKEQLLDLSPVQTDIQYSIKDHLNNTTDLNNLRRINLTPITYFKVNGVECKMENGQVYQKQWVDVDETHYKISTIKGKRVIMKLDWVVVENKD
jgi:hypothetical protein